MNIEEIRKCLEETWNSKAKRSPTLATGKGGVISFLENLHERPLTQEEKDNIEDGMYTIDMNGIRKWGENNNLKIEDGTE